MKNPIQNFNVKPEVALAFGVGTTLGSMGMALVARHEQRKFAALVEKQSNRQHAKFKYVMDNIAPFAPSEALIELTTYLEADLMASYEEGIELGMSPEGEEPTAD